METDNIHSYDLLSAARHSYKNPKNDTKYIICRFLKEIDELNLKRYA